MVPTMPRCCSLTLQLLALGALLAVRAFGLEWKTTELSTRTQYFQSEIEVSFDFSNRSERPVLIRDLETSCSCLQAVSDLKSYPPGASGKITARFTVGDRQGVYERIITVVTDEPDEPRRLIVRIEVPALAEISPRSVEWVLNEAPVEKIVEIRSAAGLEIAFTDAQATGEEFEVDLRSVVPGRFYRLAIKPKSTAKPAGIAVRLTGREKSGHDILVSAYASVPPAAQR